jgi:tetratricopeptide (TPR) repeat protein
MPQAGAQAQPRPNNDIGQAIALHQQGHLDAAAQIYGAILDATPDQPDALNLLGMVRHQQGRNIEALQLVGDALKRAGRSADVINNFALILGALERHEEALAHFERALAINGKHINALANQARTLSRLKRDEEALGAYQHLLAAQPDHLDALNESGGVNMRLGRPQAAIACFERALAIAPLTVELLVNRGTALRALNRDEDALASFAAAAALKPDFAEAHWNASLVRLWRGDFARGWKDYERRWHKADWRGKRRNFRQPLWLGKEPIAGKTILLHSEQGLGDTIQFVRYAPLLVARGANVLLVVQPPLQTLIGSVPGVSGVFVDGEPLPAFDVHCPLLSLPLAFGTELATVPANIPYLRPYAERTAKWQSSLPRNGRLRVGICWAGGREHLNNHSRSIPLDGFASMLSVSGLDFVSIQKEVSETDAAILRQHGVAQLGQQFADFADTAAVVDMLDLVIAVDTSVAHLAGAMGKPAWVLVPFASDWRWLRERTDSPWYPTMRLFRQTALGDWSGPLEQLRKQLSDAVSSSS